MLPGALPDYDIKVFHDSDTILPRVEEMFEQELAFSRQPLPADRPDRNQWQFCCVCALTSEGVALGGVHMDVGPMNAGPLADERMAFLEHVIVKPEYRRHGLGALLMRRALLEAKDLNCLHVRGNVRWDDTAAIALYRRAGFALVDLAESDQGGEYFVVKPLE